MRTARWLAGLLVLPVLLGMAVPAASQGRLIPVVFQLNITPSPPDHTYFEVGIAKGFYREEGLDVTLENGTGSSNTLRLVGTSRPPLGFVDVGTMILGVVRGIPVKSVMVINQGSPMAVIFKKSKGYKTIKDLRGASVATTQAGSLTQIWPVVLRANGMSTSDLRMIYTGSPTAKEVAMLAGNADAYLGFYTENAVRNQMAGHDVAWIKFSDAGVNIMNLAVIANSTWLKDNAAIARAFVRGTQKAIKYTVVNPKEAAAIFHRKHSRDFSEEIVLRMLQAGLPLLQTPNSKGLPYGAAAEGDWQTSERYLAEYAKFKPLAGISLYYTNEFAMGR
ncbi:MAG: ABC transporter substrate-binding protein [Armatimonadetes bacterium]|nr:ABC transporter substrate-binding protein [Armatimonadota bacterium]